MTRLPEREWRGEKAHGRGAGLRCLPFAPILAGALSVILSCNPLANNVGWGGLTIEVTPMQSLLMAPGIDMTNASYIITGTGPNGAAFSKTISGSSLSLPGLAFGAWSISVDGQNASGVLISHGESSVSVVSGANQTVSITMSPVIGPGTFGLTVTWLASSMDIPAIQSQLIPSQGPPIDLGFTMAAAGKATYSNAAVPNGYYTLVVNLLDNGQLVMGAVDVVRIIKDQTTSGTIDFSQVNTGTGSIAVNITPTMNTPIQVTMSGQQATLGTGAATTVTASVPSGVGNVTYVWYLNGVSKAMGSTFTFNTASAPLALGVYRLDVAAFTSNGAQGGSATYTFKVASSGTATLLWNANTDPTVTGYKFYQGTASGVYGTPVDVGTATSYTSSGLLSGVTYYFAVTCYNSSKQESTYSNVVTYTAP